MTTLYPDARRGSVLAAHSLYAAATSSPPAHSAGDPAPRAPSSKPASSGARRHVSTSGHVLLLGDALLAPPRHAARAALSRVGDPRPGLPRTVPIGALRPRASRAPSSCRAGRTGAAARTTHPPAWHTPGCFSYGSISPQKYHHAPPTTSLGHRAALSVRDTLRPNAPRTRYRELHIPAASIIAQTRSTMPLASSGLGAHQPPPRGNAALLEQPQRCTARRRRRRLARDSASASPRPARTSPPPRLAATGVARDLRSALPRASCPVRPRHAAGAHLGMPRPQSASTSPTTTRSCSSRVFGA